MHRTFEPGIFGGLSPLVLSWSTGWTEDEAEGTQTPSNRESPLPRKDLIVLDSIESKFATVLRFLMIYSCSVDLLVKLTVASVLRFIYNTVTKEAFIS